MITILRRSISAQCTRWHGACLKPSSPGCLHRQARVRRLLNPRVQCRAPLHLSHSLSSFLSASSASLLHLCFSLLFLCLCCPTRCLCEAQLSCTGCDPGAHWPLSRLVAFTRFRSFPDANSCVRLSSCLLQAARLLMLRFSDQY